MKTHSLPKDLKNCFSILHRETDMNQCSSLSEQPLFLCKWSYITWTYVFKQPLFCWMYHEAIFKCKKGWCWTFRLPSLCCSWRFTANEANAKWPSVCEAQRMLLWSSTLSRHPGCRWVGLNKHVGSLHFKESQQRMECGSLEAFIQELLNGSRNFQLFCIHIFFKYSK